MTAVVAGTSYSYRAARLDGAIESGVLDADSHAAASAALAERGLFPVEIRIEREHASERIALPVADLAVGLRVLATLLESGLPMSRVLAAFAELAPASWEKLTPSLAEAVRSGKSLGAALAAAPVEIPTVVVGIIQAGEGGSGIATAVRRAAELTEATATRRAAIQAALAYPVILAVAGTASVALLVGVVLPRFSTILADLGQALPPATRLVLALAEFARAAALPGLIALIIVAVAWRAWLRTETGARRWAGLLLDLPLVGGIRLSAASARTSAVLASLLDSGVSVSSALLHAARAAGDAEIAARIRTARESVVAGQGMARALGAERAVTTTTVRLVRAGEETGQLPAMLWHAAKLEGEQAERHLRSAVRLLEPALIIVFGGMVALIAAALLQAIYSVRAT
jgi:type II secretory pathway component PulF